MDLLANENVPASVVAGLRAEGHDVLWVRTETPGAADTDVLAGTVRDQRILLTFDKDFGELAFRSGLPAGAGAGIILCRFRLASPEQACDHVVTALSSRSDWVGHFSVIEDDRIRMTPLPKTREGTGTG